MDVKSGLFYLFSALMLFAAFRVITARNPVHAALFLVFAFFQAAGVWILLKAEFLGIALVLVYVGAVMVLFLFVVMMLDINLDTIRQGFWKHFPLAAEVKNSNTAQAVGAVVQSNNTKDLGVLLYTKYLYPLEIAAAILLVAIIAAIALTLRQRKDSKHTDPGDQVRIKSRDRMEVIKMTATQPFVVETPVAAVVSEEKKA